MARKILIADDSPTVQKKASGILTGEGIEVVTVSNGVAAIKKLPVVNPMVILADVSMPGKDGYEVCEFVKGSAEFSGVPVVLVFSDDDTYEEQKGARVRADGRIKKPFERDELIATVNKFLAISEAAAAKAQAPVIKAAPPPPPPTYVSEPMDEEPVIAPKEASPDFSEFGGVAFAETALEEIHATPETSIESAPSPEPPVIEAEGLPAVEPMIEAETPAAAEPVFVEEEGAPSHTHEHESVTEHTIMFHAPAEIAQPVLSDEVAPEPPPVEAPPLETSPESTTAETNRMEGEGGTAAAGLEAAPEVSTESAPVSASTLDSYSLNEAAAGNVRFAPADIPAEPSSASSAPTAQTAQALDPAQVYSIVHRVVAKMSPRLSAQSIEDMAKNLSDEINAELKS
ncbi:MAG: response regulator [Terriglobia bacterium]